MDKLEHTFKTLGKFLAIASAVKLYKIIYGDDIPQIEIIRILNDLQIISDDYLHPKYVIKKEVNFSDDFPNTENGSYYTSYDADVVDDNNDIGC